MKYKDFQDERWELMASAKHPSRYAGCEWGEITPKEDSAEMVRMCLCFPDVYEVGMSYVGFQILYPLIKDLSYADVERAYCPWPDMERNMKAKGVILGSVESNRPLNSFDVVGFTLQYELSHTNIITMLDLGGIPVFSEDRGDDDPIVMAGGPCALTPETIAPFIDVFALGDGEEYLPAFLEVLKGTRGLPRDKRLRALAEIPGSYVPALIHRHYGDDGVTFSSELKLPFRKQIVLDMDEVYQTSTRIVPSSSIVHDRLAVEVFRGCTRGCRFCQAGMTYRPVRERSVDKVIENVKKLAKYSGWEEVSLVSLASCDYSGIERVITDLADYLNEKRMRLSLPSLRVDNFSISLAAGLKVMKKGGLTLAPEAGTQRLRNVINKGVSEENIESSLKAAFENGWERVKLYFMMGLPTETEEDLSGIVDIAEMAVRIGRSFKRKATVSASVAGFVPKGHTPFQWEPQLSMKELAERGRWLKSRIRSRKISLKYHEPRQTFLEGVFARGDSRLAPVIYRAWQKGARFDGWSETFNFPLWMETFEECSIDPESYANRERGRDEGLPWDHIDAGVTRSFLWRERENAYAGLLSPDCRQNSCRACGWENRGCAFSGRKKGNAQDQN